MKRFTIILLILILVSSLSISQSLSKGFKLLEKGEISEAKTIFDNLLKLDSSNAPALYGLASCYGNLNLFKSFYFNRKANKLYDNTDDKTLKKLDEYFTKDLIAKQFCDIDSKLVKYVKEKYSLNLVNTFLTNCSVSNYTNDIILLRDSIEFSIAQNTNTELIYNDYVKNFPNSKFKNKCISIRDSIAFNSCKGINTIASYNQYLKNYPESDYAERVANLRNVIAFADAKKENTINAYNSFIATYPDAEQVKRANESIAFLKAKEINTIDTLNYFITLYPNAEQVSIAKEIIKNLIQWKKNGLYGISISNFAIDGTDIYALTTDGRLFLNTNNDSIWANIYDFCVMCEAVSFALIGNNIIIGTHGQGGWLSTDKGKNFNVPVQIARGTIAPNQVTPITAFGVNGKNIYAIDIMGNVYISNDGGGNWSLICTWDKSGLQSFINGSGFIFVGENIFVSGAGVSLSNNNGISWHNVGLANTFVSALALIGTNIFAGTEDGVFLSTNNGTNWIPVNGGLLDKKNISSIIASGTNIFAATDNGVYLSNDDGASWKEVNDGLSNLKVNSLTICGTNIYLGTESGIWIRPLSAMVRN
jgi:photosystem II stability/assembly factor-like uncharacterized protein